MCVELKHSWSVQKDMWHFQLLLLYGRLAVIRCKLGDSRGQLVPGHLWSSAAGAAATWPPLCTTLRMTGCTAAGSCTALGCSVKTRLALSLPLRASEG